MENFFNPDPTSEDRRSDRYGQTRFRLNVVFKPTDYLEVRWRFHAPHGARWGTGNLTDLRTAYAFARVKTAAGTISAGRISSDIDSAGLQTLGYSPTWGFSSQGFIFDSDSEKDAVMYRNDWSNGFGLKAFYAKRAHTAPTAAVPAEDVDWDRFSLEPYYKWDGGGMSVAVQYDNDKRANVVSNYIVSVNPAVTHKFAIGEKATLALNAELKYSAGELQSLPDTDSIDQSGFGVYGDLTLGYGTGSMSLAGWWLGGNDEGATPDTPKKQNLVGSGQAFYPFLIFNQNLMGASITPLGGVPSDDYKTDNSNHWGLALLGNHTINKYVTFNYGLGYFGKVADYYLTPDETVSKNLGTEVDLGITAKLMDNITYTTKFGFFFPGDYYNERYKTENYDGTVWGWANEFIFSF
ncbi:MAG: hypothetical protein LBF41_03505 [Deltaproteobacteria bacterium]|jgi:hypothetical protein|nr:hypothetical protein [Deltaproteobacteria bacterium]